MTRGRSRLALALTGVAIGLVGPAAIASAASPEPSFAPVRPPAIFQAWLDSEFIVPDAPPGGVLQAGFTFWNSREQDFGEIGGIYAKLSPASGDAPPSEATIESDFPGHVLASFIMPEGGPGEVEVGTRIDACTEAGCGDVDAPFTISGTGPPPDADPATLLTAEFLPFGGDTVAGRTFPVNVIIRPRGLWDFAAIELPEALEIVASAPGQPALASAPLLPGTEPGTPYSGRLTISETGPVELSVVVARGDGATQVIDGEPAELTVIEGGRRQSTEPAPAETGAPAPAAPAADEGGVPMVVIVGIVGVAVIGAGLVLRRVLADL
jgi:hypothetical protein